MLPRLECQNVISHSAHADETHSCVDRQLRIISLGKLTRDQGARSVVSKGEKKSSTKSSKHCSLTHLWWTLHQNILSPSDTYILPHCTNEQTCHLGLMIFANCVLFYSSWLWTVGQICSALGVWTFTNLSFYAVRIALACLEGFIVSNYVVKLLCWCISSILTFTAWVLFSWCLFFCAENMSVWWPVLL